MADARAGRGSSATTIRWAAERMRAAQGRARQFWRLFNSSHVPMVVVDNERSYLAANIGARLVFRLRLEELLKRRIDDLTPPHMVHRMLERWDRLLREGDVFGAYDVGFPDGSELQIVYYALANVLPAQHLIVFAPADWPGDELTLGEDPPTQAPDQPLSAREREILSLIAAGSDMNQIAGELMISAATVRTHSRNALRKLGARNRAHAVALALRADIIDPPGPNSHPLT